jgi:protein TonB
MSCANQNRFLLPAWGLSLTFHGAAVVLAMLFTAQVRPIPQQEPFKWDVALVEADKTHPAPEATSAPVAQRPAPVAPSRPVERTSETAVHKVAPRQSVQMVHPEIRAAKPTELREDPIPPPKIEPEPAPGKPLQEKPFEPIEQPIAEAPKTRPEPVSPAKESEPVQSVEPVVAQRQPLAPAPPEELDRHPMDAPAKPSAFEPIASSSPAEPAPAASSSPSDSSEVPMQTARAVPAPEVKADHRWVGESLWRRVAELKRYPNSARLNGQEGKVILKAVIRSDGHLAEVSVQKSSGHQILDAAAIEAVKLACPLHLKHAISKSEIVVSLPIVYSLAN